MERHTASSANAENLATKVASDCAAAGVPNVLSLPPSAPAPSIVSAKHERSHWHDDIPGDRYCRWTERRPDSGLHRDRAQGDPAAPVNSFETAPSGDHLVGVEFQIKRVSGSEQDDANNDAVVTGNDQQTYQSGFEGLAAGTNFSSGNFNTSPGSSSIGWVSFEVKDGVTIQPVQWTAGSGFGSPVTWTVP